MFENSPMQKEGALYYWAICVRTVVCLLVYWTIDIPAVHSQRTNVLLLLACSR